MHRTVLPCTKSESKGMIRRKGMDTILNLTKPCLATAYTNGSSDSYCNREGSGVFHTYPNCSDSKHKVPARKITCNFMCKLIPIVAILDIYLACIYILHFDCIIEIWDCKSLKAIQGGKKKVTQEINSLLLSVVVMEKSCTLQ